MDWPTYRHMQVMADTPDAPEERIPGFNRLLYVLYLINDCLFNYSVDDNKAPDGQLQPSPYHIAGTPQELTKLDFRDMVFPQLPTMVHLASKRAELDLDREKVARVVQLWGEKAVFNTEEMTQLREAMTNATEPPPRPPSPPLAPLPPPLLGYPPAGFMPHPPPPGAQGWGGGPPQLPPPPFGHPPGGAYPGTYDLISSDWIF